MKTIRKHLLPTCLALLTVPGTNVLADDAVADLDPAIRGLLQQEMTEVDAAMKEIYTAMTQGKHNIVEEKGQAIHDSFILAQSLSEEDRQALKSTLPKGFLELDQRFHRLAAELSKSGMSRDTTRQQQLFGEMTDACITCHQRYAGERFEALRQDTDQ